MAFWNRNKGPQEKPLGLDRADAPADSATENRAEQPVNGAEANSERMSFADIKALRNQRIDTAKSRVNQTKDNFSQRLGNLWSRVRGVPGKIREGASYAVVAPELVKAGRDYVSDKGAQLDQAIDRKIEQGVDYVGDKAEQGIKYVSGKAEQGAQYVSTKAEQGKEYVSAKAQEVMTSAEQAYQQLEARAAAALESFQNRKNEIMGSLRNRVREFMDNRDNAKVVNLLQRQAEISKQLNVVLERQNMRRVESTLPSVDEGEMAVDAEAEAEPIAA